MRHFVLQKFLVVVCLALLCSVIQAAPALVSTLDNCLVGWVSADPLPPAALPNIVLIQGTGISVTSNNGRGYTQFHCKARLDFSQPVLASNFFTFEPVMVTLADFGQACIEIGFCPSGLNGAAVIDGSSGFTCETFLGPTSDWHAVVTPSGQSKIVCRIHESPAE
jgi:hypothetical protein